MITKTCKVNLDEIVIKFASAFDYDFTGESKFSTADFDPPTDFNIGLIVGNSGSGKTLLLEEHFGKEKQILWEKEKAIVSHFNSFEESCEKLFSVGLSSVPTLCKPFHVLSNGEKYRAHIARL